MTVVKHCTKKYLHDTNISHDVRSRLCPITEDATSVQWSVLSGSLSKSLTGLDDVCIVNNLLVDVREVVWTSHVGHQRNKKK